MTSLQRSRNHRGNTRHAAVTIRGEKSRVHKANRRAARRDPLAADVRINNRNVS